MEKEDYLRCEIFWDLTHREVRGSLQMMGKGTRKAAARAAF